MEFDIERLIAEIRAAPSYVKENVACYFYHNTQACRRCPKVDECPRKEPQPMPPDIGEWGKIPPVVQREYYVPITGNSCVAVPNPQTDFTRFCDVIADLANGKWAEEIRKREKMERDARM